MWNLRKESSSSSDFTFGSLFSISIIFWHVCLLPNSLPFSNPRTSSCISHFSPAPIWISFVFGAVQVLEQRNAHRYNLLLRLEHRTPSHGTFFQLRTIATKPCSSDSATTTLYGGSGTLRSLTIVFSKQKQEKRKELFARSRPWSHTIQVQYKYKSSLNIVLRIGAFLKSEEERQPRFDFDFVPVHSAQASRISFLNKNGSRTQPRVRYSKKFCTQIKNRSRLNTVGNQLWCTKVSNPKVIVSHS